MTSPDDMTYYRRRAATERVMAGLSQQREVREIHEELAQLYEALVERADLRPAERADHVRGGAKEAWLTILPPL